MRVPRKSGGAGLPGHRLSPLAEAYERGEAADFTWRRYHDNPSKRPT